ncbi:hypothetical protein BCLUESOX_1799 [bacterium endosymbiont of Bathymodiolus sp. 5 South]|nr:hypothetical protein [uncultured Gammaproteobacteria bacterium]SHN91465.1 hypothetical protein BCLUESOX_1799 [bacterium endosymbiont of Bathymodiolus sp. 5 South]VVH60204.1 hypothetical protein BSPCLSOX_2668 [uncultured Gammaproteobacteria bacterium]VVH63650.1 hypothetical protein BSPWISOX_1263 [uncultured Gammaproteobacteria bacterium]
MKITLDPVHTNSAYKQQHCHQSYSNCLPIMHWCYPMAITPMTKIQRD